MTQQPVLICDRIDQNRRNTFILLFFFVVLVAGFATVIGIVLGVPWQFPHLRQPQRRCQRLAVLLPARPPSVGMARTATVSIAKALALATAALLSGSLRSRPSHEQDNTSRLGGQPPERLQESLAPSTPPGA
jgi:hypothetical protein